LIQVKNTQIGQKGLTPKENTRLWERCQ